MRNYFLTFTFLFILPFFVFAQKEGGSNVLSPGQLWNEIAIAQHTSDKFVTQLDLQWSGSNDVTGGINIAKYTINYGARVWQHVYVKPSIKLSGFVGYWFNPQVPEIKQNENTEFRFALQGQHLKQWSRFSLYNRCRYERRWLQTDITSENKIENRIRYMPKILVGLNSNYVQAKSSYLILSDELFMKINEGNFIDQNRLTAGFGYCFNNHVSLEIAYVNRFISNQNAANEFTHALSISLGINDLFGY